LPPIAFYPLWFLASQPPTNTNATHYINPVSTAISYVDNFEFEKSFGGCHINVPPMQKEINNQFKDISIEEHDRRTKDIDIKKTEIIIDKENKEIWFTIK
jgi:hypothetical protein